MRRSTQSPRFTGLVRSGAEVVVRTAPRRSSAAAFEGVGASTFSAAPVDLTSCLMP